MAVAVDLGVLRIDHERVGGFAVDDCVARQQIARHEKGIHPVMACASKNERAWRSSSLRPEGVCVEAEHQEEAQQSGVSRRRLCAVFMIA